MPGDSIWYLNRDPAQMDGALVRSLEALPAKLQKAPAAQWASTIKSLVNKGVKQAEIDDCDVLPWLQSEALGTSKSITRDELVQRVKNRQVTVKEVTLGEARYSAYSHLECLGTQDRERARYGEILFIANSQRANIEDRIEEIDYELEQFNFDIARLSSEPEAVFRLDAERTALKLELPKAWEYSAPHFTQSAGRHGKNLIAHGRELVFGDTYLIEEVQSDWGQRGRRAKWANIPRGPFVTDTKLWAGLVVRRMLQRAANHPDVRRVAWIRGSMRNGGRQVTEDKLDEFYLSTVRGIVDKAISAAGGRTQLQNLRIGGTTFADVPGFEMTDNVRAQLRDVQPLYARTRLRSDMTGHAANAQLEAFARRAQLMLGSTRHVRFVERLFDVSTGAPVAGRFVNKIVQVALNSEDPAFVLDHECFHFAKAHLLLDHEAALVIKEFAPGTELNARTRAALNQRGDVAAANECGNAEEAAAYGFALWAAGELKMGTTPARGFFQEVRAIMIDAVNWLRRVVQQHECTSSEEVFEALLNGERASVPRPPPWRQAARA